MPPAQRACVASFVRAGHPVEVFTYERGLNVPPGARVRDASEVLPHSRVFPYGPAAGVNQGSWAGFSNVFRYYMLHAFGGYWVDTDVFCIGELPRAEVVIASERTKRGETYPTSCVLKCPAGHEFARLCAEMSERQEPSALRFGETGPRLVAWAVGELGLRRSVVEPDVFCPIDWFSYQRLDEAGDLPPSTRGVHLWNEMWRLVRRQVPWPGREGSVLARLSADAE